LTLPRIALKLGLVLVIISVLLVACNRTADQTEPIPPGYAGNPVTANDQWTPAIREFAGVEMALVPAGCFTLGSTIEDIDVAFDQCRESGKWRVCEQSWFFDETPQAEICFQKPFWIDVTEVTNRQFGTPGSLLGDDLPRQIVTWYEAVEHCEARGARLPTEAEWEYAARGPEGLLYPWGNAFDASLFNYCDASCQFRWRDEYGDDGSGTTAAVGSYPAGVSWVGALDMSGNVHEWTNSFYFDYPYDAEDGREAPGNRNDSTWRVVRGGSWIDEEYFARAANRFWIDPTVKSIDVGFRCVLSEQD
jgi:formylglycine-generating enzyme required for sulfatase activity